MTTFPSTLFEWRQSKIGTMTAYWESLRDFFEEHGYILWEAHRGAASPRDDPVIRAPDGYHNWIPLVGPLPSRFMLLNAIFFPARTTEGKDVLIRLVAKGGQGLQHAKILEALKELDVEEKHVLPLLEVLHHADMVFAVFPLVASNDNGSWFSDLAEVFDYLQQLFEAFAFIHSHRIAHWDFGSGEVLLNWAGGRFTPKGTTPSWRKSFDLCYWITDFEFAIQFDVDSESSTRLVKGVPITQLGLGAQDYRKELAPEALGDEPYCPFKSDVYQVGYCSIEIFCRIWSMPDLFNLLHDMIEEDPAMRPSFEEALATLKEIRAATSAELLAEPVEEGFCDPWASHISPENRVEKADRS